MKNRYIGLLVVAVFALACAGVVIITVLWPEPAFVPKAGAPPPTLFFSSPAPPAPFPTNAMVDTRSAAIILKGDFDAIMHLVVNRIQPPPPFIPMSIL